MYVLVAEKFQQSTQLADAHPLNLIDTLDERRVRFVHECGGNDSSYAGFSRRIGKQSGVNTVSGDDPENVRCLHRRNLAE